MAETYLSGFCGGGAAWAHAKCPAAYRDKPCRCTCHQEPEPIMPGAGPCAICQDPDDHGGRPHAEVVGDGRTRQQVERPRPTVDLELE